MGLGPGLGLGLGLASMKPYTRARHAQGSRREADGKGSGASDRSERRARVRGCEVGRAADLVGLALAIARPREALGRFGPKVDRRRLASRQPLLLLLLCCCSNRRVGRSCRGTRRRRRAQHGRPEGRHAWEASGVDRLGCSVLCAAGKVATGTRERRRLRSGEESDEEGECDRQQHEDREPPALLTLSAGQPACAPRRSTRRGWLLGFAHVATLVAGRVGGDVACPRGMCRALSTSTRHFTVSTVTQTVIQKKRPL